MPNARQVPSTPLQVQIIAAAIILSNVVYVIVAMVLRTNGALPENGFGGWEPSIAQMASGLFLLLGIGDIVAAFVLRKIRTQQLTEETDGLAPRRMITVLTMALCESAGFFGLILALFGGLHMTSWILWGLSLCAGIVLFPTQAWLEGKRKP